jgi:hypothetical protein
VPKSIFAILPVLTLALALAIPAHAQRASVSHIDLMRIWEQGVDTPDKQGLLPLAEAEGEVALYQANKAIDAVGDKQTVDQHLRNLVHAVDPGRQSAGPGKGYGLVRSAAAILARMKVAQSRSDASANVKTFGKRIMAMADHVVQRSREAMILAEKAQKGGDPSLKETLTTIRDHLSAAMVGQDDNGDGTIQPKEGGLKQLRETMARLIKAEGL